MQFTPHRFTNTIQDHKNHAIPYPKWQCVVIVLIYELYTHVAGVFGLFLLFSQIDFLLIRAVADMIVNFWSTIWFLSNKRLDPVKYNASMRMQSDGVELSNEEVQLLEKPIIIETDCSDEVGSHSSGH